MGGVRLGTCVVAAWFPTENDTDRQMDYLDLKYLFSLHFLDETRYVFKSIIQTYLFS